MKRKDFILKEEAFTSHTEASKRAKELREQKDVDPNVVILNRVVEYFYVVYYSVPKMTLPGADH
jgi:hypothetical protein